jgi:predicted transcriptional regulator
VTKSLNETELSVGIERARSLAECLLSIGHPSRLKIVEYCSEKPRRFTDIILNLQLNPASFKFHAKVLVDSGLIRKVERGIYETTELGRLLLELVNQASRLSN